MRTSCTIACLCLTLAAVDLHADGVRLSGYVVDAESGTPLAGATVVIRAPRQGTQTDLSGHYSLGGLATGTTEVEFSLIGYATVHRHPDLSEGDNQLDIKLSAKPIHLGEMLVRADRPLSAASSRAVRDFDLQVRPKQSAHQMLQMAPGLIIAQHAGGGKAEQIFLRNFDADHGTDVAVSVDGMPVNMVSHGHGQGYADLHFLIPDVVEGLDVYKGPYFARFGNLATAGAVAFRTRNHLPDNLLRVEGGSFGTTRVTALYELPLEDPDNSAYFAGEYYRTDGPVHDPQGLRRLNVFTKFRTRLSADATLTVAAGGFTSAWNASGQIPQRAIDRGLIDRWGSIDPLEGGGTGRQNLNVTFRGRARNNADFTSRIYASWYDFKLFSNFTFFLEHPDVGDMIEQLDDRVLFGMDNTYSLYHHVGGYLAQSTFGGGLRADNTDVALWHSPERIRKTALVDTRVAERNAYLWAQEELFLGPRLRLVLGLRADYFTFDVDDRLEAMPGSLPHASGVAQDEIFSPKAGLIYSPTPSLDLFLNAGSGFHSNDARAIIIDRRAADIARVMAADGATPAQIDAGLAAQNIDPDLLGAGLLPRAVGAEIGTRVRLGHRINVAAAAWWLALEEEFVYVGDAGTTEPSGGTRRLGLDLEARAQLTPWLWFDADATFSDGKLVDAPAGSDEIPLAPRLTTEGGLTVRHPDGFDGSVRLRHIGDRPADEDGAVTALGYTVVNADAGYRWERWQIHLAVENLLNVEWNEAQFDTRTRLPGEAGPVSELHFTPGNPFGVRLGLSYLL